MLLKNLDFTLSVFDHGLGRLARLIDIRGGTGQPA
jgi:hypothetical protein